MLDLGRHKNHPNQMNYGRKPTLSIITVCRNEVSRIQRTIDSVMQQSDSDFEWIIVDGASTDGTLQLLQSYQPRISLLISEPDRGLYDAMNKGIRMASGEFVLFLNAGDYLQNREVVSAFYKRTGTSDIVIGGILIVYPDDREQYRKSTGKNLDRELLYWRSFDHQVTFIKRVLFEKFGSYDLSFKILADWEFFARVVVRQGVSVEAWDHYVAVYSFDGISARLENRQQLYRERQRIRRMHYPARYRWRRNFNEAWGAMIHRIRQQIQQVRKPQYP